MHSLSVGELVAFNILAGRVVSAAEVEVEGLRIALATGRAMGEIVQLVVRPEMIELDPGAAARRAHPAEPVPAATAARRRS